MSTYAKIFEALLNTQQSAGVTLSGGKVYFYAPGTYTEKTVYVDRNKSAPAANPYTLSAEGTAEVYGDGLYDIGVYDSTGVLKHFWEDVSTKDVGGDTVNADDFGGLAAAAVVAGAAGRTVVVSTHQVVATPVTWPADRDLKFENGGSLLNSAAFTINGVFTAPRMWVFKGAGAVTFGKATGIEIYPEWFAPFDTVAGTGDAGIAINKAIAAVAGNFTAPRLIRLGSGTYNVDTPIDLTSTAFEKSYIQIIGGGFSTNVQANTGSRLFDCVGTNHLLFKDFYIVPGATNCSTIGFLFWRGLADNFSHLSKIEGVKLELKSIHTANNGFGSIGILNVEGEDHTYQNIYMGANSPVVFDRCGVSNSLGFAPTSYVALQTTPTSFGTATFGGKNSLIAFNAWASPVYMNGINSLDLGASHMGGGTSPWDSDTTGINTFAVITGPNPVNLVRHFGLVEAHSQYLKLGAAATEYVGQIYMGDNSSATLPFIDIGAHNLLNSSLGFVNGNAIRLPLVTGTGALQQVDLRGYNTLRYLSPAVALTTINTTVTTDGNVITYGDKYQTSNVAKTAIPDIIDYLVLPVAVTNSNAGVITYTLSGTVHTVATNDQATAPAAIDFISSVNIVVTKAGTYTVGTPKNTVGNGAAGGTTALTAVALTAVVNAGVVEITITPTGANLTTSYVAGTKTIRYDGFSGQAPTLR